MAINKWRKEAIADEPRYLIQSRYIMADEVDCVTNLTKNFVVVGTSLMQTCTKHELNTYIPVGTVEFVREFCKQAKMQLPKFYCYPTVKWSDIERKIRSGYFKDAHPDEFVKPIDTKIFTGNIKSKLTESVDPHTLCYISDPVDFIAEWRLYIVKNSVVGYSRYDHSDEEIELPFDRIELWIKELIEANFKVNKTNCYSIDIGMLRDSHNTRVADRFALVEMNDGWSLGYYKWGNMKPIDYLNLITARWQQIMYLNSEYHMSIDSMEAFTFAQSGGVAIGASAVSNRIIDKLALEEKHILELIMRRAMPAYTGI
jgi:hypothetical protein